MAQRTFEECYSIIASVIEKKRSSWTLKNNLMRDFDDVKMEIIAHIWKKWALYDQSRKLESWVAQVTHHQYINILKEAYMGTASPCMRCAMNMGDDRCRTFGTQSSECKLYKDWEKERKHIHQAKNHLSLENHNQEAYDKEDHASLEALVPEFNNRVKRLLTPLEYEIYNYIFLDGKDEKEIAVILGYPEGDTGFAGYKRVKHHRNEILKKIKDMIKKEGM